MLHLRSLIFSQLLLNKLWNRRLDYLHFLMLLRNILLVFLLQIFYQLILFFPVLSEQFLITACILLIFLFLLPKRSANLISVDNEDVFVMNLWAASGAKLS